MERIVTIKVTYNLSKAKVPVCSAEETTNRIYEKIDGLFEQDEYFSLLSVKAEDV